jgi:DNA-binding transcriptional ArsR family regulator
VDATRLRALSKELLGNKYRLEIAAEIAASDDPVHAQGLADATGVRYPRVQEELKRLRAAGILAERSDPGSNIVQYKTHPSVYWDMCRQLRDELLHANDLHTNQ